MIGEKQPKPGEVWYSSGVHITITDFLNGRVYFKEGATLRSQAWMPFLKRWIKVEKEN